MDSTYFRVDIMHLGRFSSLQVISIWFFLPKSFLQLLNSHVYVCVMQKTNTENMLETLRRLWILLDFVCEFFPTCKICGNSENIIWKKQIIWRKSCRIHMAASP